jgi:CRISPR/Cas system CMR-associated protein Cmr5 small subunit
VGVCVNRIGKVKSHLVKKFQNIRISILKHDDDWVEFLQEFEYVAYNASSGTVTEKISVHWDWETSAPSSLLEKSGVMIFHLDKRSSEKEAFKSIATSSAKNKLDRSEDHYEVDVEVAPEEQLRVQMTIRRPKHATDYEMWLNTYLCESVDVEIRFDRDKYHVEHKMIHPSTSKASVRDLHDGVKLEFLKPLLPSNGILIWWRPLRVRAV